MPSTRSYAGSKRRFSTLTPIPENVFEPPSPETHLPVLPRGHSLDYNLPYILDTVRQHYKLPLPPASPPPPTQSSEPQAKRQKQEIGWGRHVQDAQAGDRIDIPPRAFKDYNGYDISVEDKIYVDAEGVRWQAVEIKMPWLFKNLVPDYQSHCQEESMKALREEPPMSPRSVPEGARLHRPIWWLNRRHAFMDGVEKVKSTRWSSSSYSAADLAQDLSREVEAAWDLDEDIAHPFFAGMFAIYSGRSISVA